MARRTAILDIFVCNSECKFLFCLENKVIVSKNEYLKSVLCLLSFFFVSPKYNGQVMDNKTR